MKKLIFLLWAIASTALATPPEMISLYDRVIGYSDTQVFILRETNDNLGLYIYGLHDVFLVAKNLETGLDEQIWPVYRVIGDNESTPEASGLPLQGVVNPFEILSKAPALFTNRNFSNPNLARRDEEENDDAILTVSDITPDPAALMAQIAQSISFTSAAIQPYPDGNFGSMSFESPQEMLGYMAYTPPDCQIDGVETLFRYPRPDISLARLECMDEDGAQVWLVVLLPTETDSQ